MVGNLSATFSVGVEGGQSKEGGSVESSHRSEKGMRSCRDIICAVSACSGCAGLCCVDHCLMDNQRSWLTACGPRLTQVPMAVLRAHPGAARDTGLGR